MIGVDVSYWQGQIDWELVKESGRIDFAIIRGGVSTAMDRYAKRNLSECNRLGIPVGIYWFSHALNETGARLEAEAAINLAQQYDVAYPIYFDSEYESADVWSKLNKRGMTADDFNSLAWAFCEKIEWAGYFAGIYANQDYLENYVSRETLKRFSFWLAWYNDRVQNFPVRSHGKTYPVPIQQYTNVGHVPGISGNVDMNIDNINLAQLIEKAGLNKRR